MIDLKKLTDLFSDKVYGQYNSYPHIVKSEQDRVLMHLIEELGEVMKSWRKSGYGHTMNGIMFESLEDEISDVVILAGLFSVGAGIDLDKAVAEKLHKNYLEGKVLLDVSTILDPTLNDHYLRFRPTGPSIPERDYSRQQAPKCTECTGPKNKRMKQGHEGPHH